MTDAPDAPLRYRVYDDVDLLPGGGKLLLSTDDFVLANRVAFAFARAACGRRFGIWDTAPDAPTGHWAVTVCYRSRGGCTLEVAP